MKRETNNNEIDLLLRRLGRRENGGASEAPRAIDSEHLDADELSSYAQNALPAAARARYTAHLAECSACRKLVTQLSLTLGAVTTAERTSAVPASGGLQTFLAKLFSPMVLRYAAPALGVVLVMVIGFIALRQRSTSSSSLVAKLDEKREVTAPATGAETKANSSIEKDNRDTGKQDERNLADSASGKQTESKPAATPAAESSGTAPPPAAKEAAPVVAQRQVQELPEPQSTATANLTPGVEQKKPDETAGRKAETVTVNARNTEVKDQANEPVKTAGRTDNFVNEDRIAISREAAKRSTAGKNVEPDKNKVAAPAAGVASVGSRSELARSRAAGAAKNERAADRDKRAADEENRPAEETKRAEKKRVESEDDEVETETRTVAGRRFHKQRGVWIDNAYDSSKDATTVSRNSEQFRALVADEPAIRTIAEQLDGEILVVWKGRTYRIR